MAQREAPACILLDIILPDKDGWSVLRELKADPRTAAIPVLICSILGEPGYALSLAAAGTLSKPLMRSELLRKLPPLLADERSLILSQERSLV
jgi:CheY-like chemotaxis protein